MRLCVLGAAAGGGFPQWNAGSEACRRARAGDPAARPATQASLALSVDGDRWLLINASPDLRTQIEASPGLWPRSLRSSPIAAVVLTNADVDAVAGLLTLREGTGFAVYAHPCVLRSLDANPIFDVVDRRIVPRHALALETPFRPCDAQGADLGLELEAFAVPGKVPLYQEGLSAPVTDSLAGETIGLCIRATAGRIHYLANCAAITGAIRKRVAGAALVFMDGTLWRDDEMILAGVGSKTGRRMGHIAMSGPQGAMAALSDLAIGQRIFIHINNTNPALLSDSAERRELEARGWEVAFDGMEIDF